MTNHTIESIILDVTGEPAGGMVVDPVERIRSIVHRAEEGGADSATALMALLISPAPDLRRALDRTLDSAGPPLWAHFLEALALGSWADRTLAVPPASTPVGHFVRRRLRLAFVARPGTSAYEAQRLVLHEALHHRSSAIQAVACDLVGERVDRGAVPALIELLETGSLQVREAAAHALGRIADPVAVEPLLRSLHVQHDVLSRYVAEALAQIGEPAVPALIDALASSDANVRWHAATALAAIADPHAAAALVNALYDNLLNVRWKAAEALAALGTPGVVEVLRAIETRPITSWFADGARYVLQHASSTVPHLATVVDSLRRATAPVEAPVQAALILAELRTGRPA